MNIKEKSDILKHLNGLKGRVKQSRTVIKNDLYAIKSLIAGDVGIFHEYIKQNGTGIYQKKENHNFLIKKKKSLFSSIKKNKEGVIAEVMNFRVPYLDIELFLLALNQKKISALKEIIDKGLYSNIEEFYFQVKNNKFYSFITLNQFTIPILSKMEVFKSLLNGSLVKLHQNIGADSVAGGHPWMYGRKNILFGIVDQSDLRTRSLEADNKSIKDIIQQFSVDINFQDPHGDTIGHFLINSLKKDLLYYNLSSVTKTTIIMELINYLACGLNPDLLNTAGESISSIYNSLKRNLYQNYDLSKVQLLEELIHNYKQRKHGNNSFSVNNFWKEIIQYKKNKNSISHHIGICLFANQKSFIGDKAFLKEDFSVLSDEWVSKLIKERQLTAQSFFRLLKNDSLKKIFNGEENANLYNIDSPIEYLPFLFGGKNFWFYPDLSKIIEVLRYTPIDINKQDRFGDTPLIFNFKKLLTTDQEKQILNNILILISAGADGDLAGADNNSFISLCEKNKKENWFPIEIINAIEEKKISDSIKNPNQGKAASKI